MPTFPPRKISMIKDIREVTGLSLVDAKNLMDYMYRLGGPVHSLISDVLASPEEAGAYLYNNVMPPRIAGSLEEVTVSAPSGDLLEERVARIERWIQNQ